MARTLRKAVPRILHKQLRTVVACLTSGLEGERDRDLHAARVAVKRLRYNLEFFRSLLGDEADGALDLLVLAQERLGTISDAATFERAYGALLDGLEFEDPRRAGIEARRRAAQAERARALEGLNALWSRDGDRLYPERLAASISAALTSPSLSDDA
jgi:CHAD domain-containing protein